MRNTIGQPLPRNSRNCLGATVAFAVIAAILATVVAIGSERAWGQDLQESLLASQSTELTEPEAEERRRRRRRKHQESVKLTCTGATACTASMAPVAASVELDIKKLNCVIKTSAPTQFTGGALSLISSAGKVVLAMGLVPAFTGPQAVVVNQNVDVLVSSGRHLRFELNVLSGATAAACVLTGTRDRLL